MEVTNQPACLVNPGRLMLVVRLLVEIKAEDSRRFQAQAEGRS